MLIRFSGLFLGQVGGEAGKDSGAVSGEFHGAMHRLIPQSLRDSPQGQGERIPPRRYRGSPFCRPSASGISHVPTLCLHWATFPTFARVFHAQRPTHWTLRPLCRESTQNAQNADFLDWRRGKLPICTKALPPIHAESSQLCFLWIGGQFFGKK